jgi:hypothetical protein
VLAMSVFVTLPKKTLSCDIRFDAVSGSIKGEKDNVPATAALWRLAGIVVGCKDFFRNPRQQLPDVPMHFDQTEALRDLPC